MSKKKNPLVNVGRNRVKAVIILAALMAPLFMTAHMSLAESAASPEGSPVSVMVGDNVARFLATGVDMESLPPSFSV